MLCSLKSVNKIMEPQVIMKKKMNNLNLIRRAKRQLLQRNLILTWNEPKSQNVSNFLCDFTWTEEICRLQPMGGDCEAYNVQFYFNAKIGRCQAFHYGGCGRNANRFAKIKSCETVCGQFKLNKPHWIPINQMLIKLYLMGFLVIFIHFLFY